MRSHLFVFIALFGVAAASAQDDKKETERLGHAATVLQEILAMPEGIPQNLLDKSECVVVFPGVKKAAIGIGGSYGRGAMSCRTGASHDGPWSAPAMYALEGASIGFQLGGSDTDFVMLVMNDKGANSVLSSKVKLGADAAIAAGPKGREAEAATNPALKAEILSYSRSKGAFAGVSLEGSTLRSDGDANKNLYGKPVDAKQIVTGNVVQTPPEGQPFVDALTRKSPKNLSEKK